MVSQVTTLLTLDQLVLLVFLCCEKLERTNCLALKVTFFSSIKDSCCIFKLIVSLTLWQVKISKFISSRFFFFPQSRYIQDPNKIPETLDNDTTQNLLTKAVETCFVGQSFIFGVTVIETNFLFNNLLTFPL